MWNQGRDARLLGGDHVFKCTVPYCTVMQWLQRERLLTDSRRNPRWLFYQSDWSVISGHHIHVSHSWCYELTSRRSDGSVEPDSRNLNVTTLSFYFHLCYSLFLAIVELFCMFLKMSFTRSLMKHLSIKMCWWCFFYIIDYLVILCVGQQSSVWVKVQDGEDTSTETWEQSLCSRLQQDVTVTWCVPGCFSAGKMMMSDRNVSSPNVLTVSDLRSVLLQGLYRTPNVSRSCLQPPVKPSSYEREYVCIAHDSEWWKCSPGQHQLCWNVLFDSWFQSLIHFTLQVNSDPTHLTWTIYHVRVALPPPGSRGWRGRGLLLWFKVTLPHAGVVGVGKLDRPTPVRVRGATSRLQLSQCTGLLCCGPWLLLLQRCSDEALQVRTRNIRKMSTGVRHIVYH